MLISKPEYQSLLNLLSRVEVKGLAEAQALLQLGQKLENRITTWYDGHVTGFKQDIAKTEADAAVVAADVAAKL